MNTDSEMEYAACIGPKANLCQPKFQEFDQIDGRFKLSWNWSARLFTFWRRLCRKIHPRALALLVLTATPCRKILSMIAAGLTANHLHYRQAKTQIPAVKEACPDVDPLEAAAEIGGANIWAAYLDGAFGDVILLDRRRPSSRRCSSTNDQAWAKAAKAVSPLLPAREESTPAMRARVPEP